MSTKISHLYLFMSKPKEMLSFYTQILGMDLSKQEIRDGLEYYYLSYGILEANLVLVYKQDFKRDFIENEGYWKIALAVEDVDVAKDALIRVGVAVGPAFQVPNVAYLCHFKDPEGYTIELIQHKFESNHKSKLPNTQFALKTPTVFSLITYRSKHIAKSLEFYKNLGMRLLSIQDVSSRGFTLYFLAFTNEKLPNSDPNAIENREWLWQRPYTVLELQHIHSNENENRFKYDTSQLNGFISLGISGNETPLTQMDPDGYKIELFC